MALIAIAFVDISSAVSSSVSFSPVRALTSCYIALCWTSYTRSDPVKLHPSKSFIKEDADELMLQ